MAVQTITSAPAGGWTQVIDPRMVRYGQKTYMGYVEGGTGDIEVRYFDHDTLTTSSATVIHAAYNVDTHAAPTFLVRDSDHRLMVFYCAHDDTTMRLRISTASLDDDPNLIGGFDASVSLDASLGGLDYTYPNAVQLTGVANDPIYLFYRDFQGGTTGVLVYSISTDGGVTWSAQTELYKTANRYAYWRVHSDGLGRIDIALTNGDPTVDTGIRAYHLYFEGGSWRTTNGTAIGAAMPFGIGDITLAFTPTTTDITQIFDLTQDSFGYPVFTISVLYLAATNSYRWVRWSGSAWSAHEVSESNGLFAAFGTTGLGAPSGFAPGIVLDRRDTNRVYFSYKVGSIFEVYTGITANAGSSWTNTPLTSGSTTDALYLGMPTDYSDRLSIYWLTGTYTTYLDNSLGIRALVTPAGATGPGVWVDWAQDGFDVGTGGGSPDHPLARILPEAGLTGVSDNITPDVISFDWTRGAASDHIAQPSPGTCTIIVQNSDGKYTPEYTSGVLYGRLKPGLPVWIGRNADGTLSGSGQVVHGVWAGYVRQIVPIPVAGASNTPTAEIICEDPLGYYSRQPVKVEDSISRSYTDLRTAILDDIGEDAARRDLGPEVDTLPLSAANSESALRVLEAINNATASRHWIEVGDSTQEWYFYTVRDRHHKLTSATDFSLNADNIQTTQGYRVTEENVINIEMVDVSPARFPAGTDTVWTYAETSFPLVGGPRVIWAQYDDFVKDAVLDYTSTGGVVTTNLTSFGRTAKIELWSASSSVVSNLTIEGRMVIRDASEAVTAEDAASQLAYGRKAGPTVSSEYSSTTALAQGVADFLVWRFSTAHPRLNVSIVNLMSTLNGKTLYDTVGLTFDRLYLAGKRYEIIGEQGMCGMAVETGPQILWDTTYELQETANQTALGLFTLDSSVLDGTDVLAN